MSDGCQLWNKQTSSVLYPLHGTRIPIMLKRHIVSFPMDSNLLTIVDISPCGYFVVMETSRCYSVGSERGRSIGLRNILQVRYRIHVHDELGEEQLVFA